MKSQFADMMFSSNFFDVALFLLSSFVTGPSFMSVLLVLELSQFFFIRYWPKIMKSEIPPCEIYPIFWDWGELGIPNLAQMSLIKCYLILQNVRIKTFTVSEFLKENQQGVKLPLPTKIRINPNRLGIFWH